MPVVVNRECHPFCVPVRKDPMTEQNMYDAGLGKTSANFEALTPLSFLGGPPGSIPTIRR